MAYFFQGATVETKFNSFPEVQKNFLRPCVFLLVNTYKKPYCSAKLVVSQVYCFASGELPKAI